jgi:Zn-dependent protease with chaperone function
VTDDTPALGSSRVPLTILAVGFVLAVFLAYVYGVPLGARLVLMLVPTSVDETIGTVSFETLDGDVVHPSRLAPAEQARLRTAFEHAIEAADGASAAPARLEFRSGDIGPNAFALPGGRIVMTDELVSLVGGGTDVIVGVLAHEYGHVRARHGMRMVAQSALLALAMSVLFGDVSSVLAGASRMLGEQAYSRDAEREADTESVRVMRAAGISPRVMVQFFDVLASKDLGSGRGPAIAFASHPADAERIAFFTRAASE